MAAYWLFKTEPEVFSWDMLKARGYKWNPGGNGRPKSWYIEVPEDAIDSERNWLEAEVFAGNGSSIVVERLDARTRYTDRVS